MSRSLALVLALGAMFATPVAHAQEAGDAVAEEGVVSGIVFQRGSGAPVEGIIVVVGERRTATDRLGRFRLEVPQGSYPVALIGADGRSRATRPVVVGAGEVTEVLVTYDASLDVLPAQVESPDVAVAVTDDVEGPAGRIEGVVTSGEDGAPVVGARIYVRGRASEAVTDAEGRFSVEVPEGSWELSIIASAYAAQRVPDVAVVADQSTPVAIDLVPAGLALDDFTVRVPKVTGGTAELLDERKQGAAVADIIGAEQMSRAGDSSAASALRRVTGLTVVDGRYIVVRGMGDRYSQTLLNGHLLPSPEPERRVVPLDLFPASILDSVKIQKTFTPDMPAEFGGGVVELRTRAFPTEPVFDIALSGGVRYGTTFADAFTYQGGPTDLFGVDGGFRRLPPDVQAASDAEPFKEEGRFSDLGYSREELQTYGRAFQNIWAIDTTRALPDWGAQLTAGSGFDLGDKGTLGAMVAFNYGNTWQTQTYDYTEYNPGSSGIERDDSYFFQKTERRYLLSSLLSLGWKLRDEQRVQASTMVLRTTEDEARRNEGFYGEESRNIRVERLRWVERQLIVQQFDGDHDLAKGTRPVRFSWRYSYARANRAEPDRRQNRYDFDFQDQVFRLSNRDGDSNSRFTSDLLDETHSGGFDVTIPIRMTDDRDVEIRTGMLVVAKDREVDTRRYSFLNRGDKAADYLSSSPEALFRPWNLRPDLFQIKEVTLPTDNYLASQAIWAGYAMARVPALSWFEVMAGVRAEASRQRVTTFEPFSTTGNEIVTTLPKTPGRKGSDDPLVLGGDYVAGDPTSGWFQLDILPAVALTFTPRDDMKVRLGYGRTVSRPEFLELSEVTFKDVTGGRERIGNSELERATIENVDARWEWFLSRGDVVSASAFFKYFDKPIEQIVIIGADQILTFDNALNATNYGFELEFRKNFGFAHPALEDLYLAMNGSYIQSEVTLDPESAGVQTNNVRPLQGQSPWMVNATLGYDSPELGINAALLFNVFGPYISDVGSFGLPDQYVQPVPQLDFVFGAELPKGFHLRYRWRNILDSLREDVLGSGEVIQGVRPGWTMDLRLGWRY